MKYSSSLRRFIGTLLVLFLFIVPVMRAQETAVVFADLPADNPNPPAAPVKLVFVHHSTGGNWLADPDYDQPYGGLGIALRDNNYFVSATNYGWGPDSIGDVTDIPNWPQWFTGPSSSAYMNALYNESGQNVGDFGYWSRLATDPGGENEIVMFKSCFPNSDLYGDPGDSPASAPSDEFTVSNVKAVYNNLLTYFETRQDKLFVVITAPPMAEGEYGSDYQSPAQRAANARAFNNWLVNDWLAGYPYHNVAVFDYYNVLTSNGSGSRTDDAGTNEEPNDAGREDGNHHRWWNGAIQHIQTIDNNFSAYPTDSNWDSHPATTGHQKATAEFVPLLNVFYNRWKSTPVEERPTPTATPAQAEQPTPTPEQEVQPTPTPAQETQPTKPPTASGVIDDFEADAENWDTDTETGSTIECGLDTGTAHDGTSSLRLQYDIELYGWTDCGKYLDPSQDWSGGSGLSLWLRSDNPGQWVTLMLFSGDPEGPTPFEVGWESREEWTQFIFAWADFERAEWADASGLSAVDPARITGYGFSVGADEAASKGTLWVDDISLVTGDLRQPPKETIPTATTVPDQETPPTATAVPKDAPPTATPKPVEPSEPEEPAEPGGGICTSAVVLPAAIVIAWMCKQRWLYP